MALGLSASVKTPGGCKGGGGAVAFVAGGLVGEWGELLRSDADGLDGGLEIGDVLGEVGVVGGADELDGCGEVGDVGGGVGVGRGGEVGGFVEDAVPCGGRGEDGDGLGRAEGGHPLFVGLAGLGFGLGGFAVGDNGGGAFVAGYNGVLQLDLEGGGAEGGGAGAPLDFKEGGEAGGVGRKRGLDRLGVEVENGGAGGCEGEEIGVGKAGLEADAGCGAAGGSDGGAVFDEDQLDGHLVAALEDEGGERDIGRRAFHEAPVFGVEVEFHCRSKGAALSNRGRLRVA
jgi:hypothetical protein